MIAKLLKWFIITICCITVLSIVTLYITGNGFLLKAIRVTYLTGHKTAFLDDYKYFDNHIIGSSKGQPWAVSEDYNSVQSTPILDSIHKKTHTIAYLIIKNDSLWYERYYDGYNEHSLTNSFSMAKSIISLILGKAIELGYIQSIDDKVKTYLPQLKGKFADELTLKHLVSMRSGLQWDESYYSPFSITTKAYFYNNLSKAMLNLPISSKPGDRFKYQSGDTQLLAMVLQKTLPMSISEFLSRYFWIPMGAEHNALWQISTDDNLEKAYCCVASNARDFARFGKLYLNHGNWNNRQLIDSNYVQQSITAAAEDSPDYGYAWWLGNYKRKPFYFMNGHLGQYVISIPEDDLIIVRLGHQTDGLGVHNPQGAFYQYIEQAYLMMDRKDFMK